MLKMRFSEKWVALIMNCFSSITFIVKFYGNPNSIMANVLSRLLHKTIEDGSIKGIKRNSFCLTISHLLFAYYTIFFLDGKISEC